MLGAEGGGVSVRSVPGDKEENFQVAGHAVPFTARTRQQHFEIHIHLV